MHDNRCLALPVCEDNGTVVGLVDVMDVIHGCGGVEGWKSIFSNSMELDDLSDTASVHSRDSFHPSARSRSSIKKSDQGKTESKTVAKLRPKKPNTALSSDSILSVTKMLATKRGNSSLILNTAGDLCGIITDTDITRRVVAKFVDPGSRSISEVMTPDPKCVSSTDQAMQALTTMVENRFRHLPVVDEKGGVVGILDIARCLNDAINKLEGSQEKKSNAAEDVLQGMISKQGAGNAQAAALQAILGSLMSQAFGDQTAPTLRSIVSKRNTTVVAPNVSIRDAAVLMAEQRRASLVVENGQLVGIFGFKDMMTRVVAKELAVDTTAVSSVMTPNPESILPDATVLDALQTMHDGNFLTLPVCEENGSVAGIVDVMDVIYGCGGAEGWKSVFNTALDYDDITLDSESQSVTPSVLRSAVQPKVTVRAGPAVAAVVAPVHEPTAIPRAPSVAARPIQAVVANMPERSTFGGNIPHNIPKTLEIIEGDDGHLSLNDSTIIDDRTRESFPGGRDAVVFKIVDPDGNTHRINCQPNISKLQKSLASKGLSDIQLQFVDDEGDNIQVASDDDLNEAVSLSRKSGNKVVKLSMKIVRKKGFPQEVLIGGAVAAVAVVAVLGIAVMMFRPRRAYY